MVIFTLGSVWLENKKRKSYSDGRDGRIQGTEALLSIRKLKLNQIHIRWLIKNLVDSFFNHLNLTKYC